MNLGDLPRRSRLTARLASPLQEYGSWHRARWIRCASPKGFWLRDDVGNALDHRDIGALFRLLSKHAGASQTRIGTATDLSQGSVCLIMNDDRVVSALDVLERIADGLAMPDAARLRLGLAPRGGLLVVNGSGTEDTTKRRTALTLGLVTALSPETLTSVLRDSAGEAKHSPRDA